MAWLHEAMGYTIIGPTSFYRLTMPEIRALQRGYNTIHENDNKGTKGRKKTGRRKSDNSKLARFKKKRGLN